MTEQRVDVEELRRQFADAFMRHPTGRMSDVEVMAVLAAAQPTGSEALREALDLDAIHREVQEAVEEADRQHDEGTLTDAEGIANLVYEVLRVRFRALNATTPVASEGGLDVDALALAMEEEYEPDTFMNDLEGFWRPFSARVAVRLANPTPASEARGGSEALREAADEETLFALDVAIRPDHLVAPHYDRERGACVHVGSGVCDLCLGAVRNNEALKRLRAALNATTPAASEGGLDASRLGRAFTRHLGAINDEDGNSPLWHGRCNEACAADLAERYAVDA